MFTLLQSQTYNQCEVDLFELTCKVLDQNLFAQVDWARNSLYFKDLRVDDQMKLLQHSWPDMLMLDHLHQRLHNGLPDETTLPNGQKFDLLGLGLLGNTSLAPDFNAFSLKMQEMKFDMTEYVCLKFIILLNPSKLETELRGQGNWKHVKEAHENVKQSLLDYSVNCYSYIQDKYTKLLDSLIELHSISERGEEHLYYKHMNCGLNMQTLLMEMLQAKRK